MSKLETIDKVIVCSIVLQTKWIQITRIDKFNCRLYFRCLFLDSFFSSLQQHLTDNGTNVSYYVDQNHLILSDSLSDFLPKVLSGRLDAIITDCKLKLYGLELCIYHENDVNITTSDFTYAVGVLAKVFKFDLNVLSDCTDGLYIFNSARIIGKYHDFFDPQIGIDGYELW